MGPSVPLLAGRSAVWECLKGISSECIRAFTTTTRNQNFSEWIRLRNDACLVLENRKELVGSKKDGFGSRQGDPGNKQF